MGGVSSEGRGKKVYMWENRRWGEELESEEDSGYESSMDEEEV